MVNALNSAVRETNHMTLKDRWEVEAERWIKWARAPDHDSYWRFHRDQFLRLRDDERRISVAERAGWRGTSKGSDTMSLA
jgi:hypothetical protein